MKTTFLDYCKSTIEALVGICVAFFFQWYVIDKSITFWQAFLYSMAFVIGGWIFVTYFNYLGNSKK